MPATQDKRDAKITTPLGPNALLLQSMWGEEQIGRMGEIRVQLLSEKNNIKSTDLLGKPVTITVGEQQQRFFHGHVTRFFYTGARGRYSTYEALIHPWLWFLTRRADCRIFQNLTVPNIIKQVFEASDYSGIADFDQQLSETYDPRVYCVQYRETDFQFVSRLMEEEGIYWYVKHQDGRHTVVMADSSSAHQNIPGTSTIPYRERSNAIAGSAASINEWRLADQVVSGAYVHSDFNFETPTASLRTNSAQSRPHDRGTLEIYDYPSGYYVNQQGTTSARSRLEAAQADCELVSGAANAPNMAVGGLFKLSDHPRADQNKDYLIIGAHYSLSNGDYEGAGGTGGAPMYSCNFTGVPKQRTYRPPRILKKPYIAGPQTATVVGPDGEEIYCDKYARIKLQFHWDRVGESNENSSCWVRVSQEWAGKNWGIMFLPRIGHEVVVSFLEGDPDQPLVTGRVYNASNMPPYTMPDNKTRSTIKSHSSLDGTGFNELRFEDKTGAEEIFLHAQLNMNRVVLNNDTVKVGSADCEQGNGNRTVEVYRDETVTIGNNQTIKIGYEVADQGDQTLEIKNNQTIKVDNDQTENIGNNLTQDVGNDHKITVGNTLVIEATTSIELKVGGSSIKIEGSKITIKSPQVNISADGTGEFKSGGPLTLESSAIANLKGSMVKIN